jgi:hypothetical protein
LEGVTRRTGDLQSDKALMPIYSLRLSTFSRFLVINLINECKSVGARDEGFLRQLH